MTSHDMLELLAPVQYGPPSVGANIVQRQPDVEVAAILLKPFPITPDKFKELAGGRDFMTMQFAVLDVGGPGFSSVPYGKKGEKPLHPLPLYTKGKDGATVFHSFLKADSNLERGVRVDQQVQEDGTAVDVTCSLAPGLCVSTYLREETLKGNVFFQGKLEGPDRARPQELQYVKLAPDSALWTGDVIPENTVVWLQVGVCNSNQAMKGSLIKIKKLMPAENGPALGSLIAAMPRSPSDFDEAMDNNKSRYPAISSSLYAGNTKIFAAAPERTAYANYDETSGDFVMCDFGSGMSEVHIEKALVTKALCCTDLVVCQRMLDVAVATGALEVCLFVGACTRSLRMPAAHTPRTGDGSVEREPRQHGHGMRRQCVPRCSHAPRHEQDAWARRGQGTRRRRLPAQRLRARDCGQVDRMDPQVARRA